MRPHRIDEIKNQIINHWIIIFCIFITFMVLLLLIYNSISEGELSIYNAGIENTPIINNDDLQYFGRLYSELNESFEREIDRITTGRANRNNKKNNVLNHYGVYGKENSAKFVNDYYEDGINIKYEKSDRYKDRPSGDSNFKDIIGAMSAIYEQKLDVATSSEIKELFEDLFWLTHTFEYDSTELYSCEYGCDAVDNYKCSDAYNDYASSNLKYRPFTVAPHDLYEDYNSEVEIEEDSIEFDEDGKRKVIKGKYRDDFNVVYPEGQCSVHGQGGAGCILDKSKLCFHGSSKVYDESPIYSEFYELVDIDYANVPLPNFAVSLFEENDIPEIESDDEEEEDTSDDEFVSKKPHKFLGMKMDKNKTCTNYKIIKYCKETEKLSKINDKIAKLNKDFAKIEEPTESQEEAYQNKLEDLLEKKAEIQEELDTHKEICERNNPLYLCGGFNLCLGHADHYRCDKHNVVVCYGHTTIKMNIKILYGQDIIDEFYKVTN